MSGREGGAHLTLEMIGHHLLQSTVEPLAVFVQDHRVGIPVQLLKRQTRVVLPLDFLKYNSPVDTERLKLLYLPE